MQNILGSASKIVFILLIVTCCAGFVIKILPVDQFMLVTMAAVSFYFTKPASDSGLPGASK